MTVTILALTACGDKNMSRETAGRNDTDAEVSIKDGPNTAVDSAIEKTPDEIYQMAIDGDYDTAVKHLNKILAKEPDNQRALDIRAECYYAQKEYAKGIEDQTRLMRLAPHAGSYLLRGQMYQGLGRHDLAEKDYTVVVQSDIEKLKLHNMQTPVLKQRLVHMMYLANSLEHQNKFEEARKVHEKILALDETDQDALQRHANILIKLKRPDLAILDYTRLIASNPGEAGLYMQRAECYIMVKNQSAARKDFEKAKSLEPDLSEQIDKKLGGKAG